jgi:phage head maturation protease
MQHFESLSFTLNKQDITSIDENGDVLFSGLAFSGNAVQRSFGMLAIDLYNARSVNSEVTLLWNHDDNALPIGKASVSIGNEINITNGTIYNDVDIPNSSGIATLVKKGHPLQLSIGISGTLLKFNSNEQKFINGKNQDVSAVISNIILEEISFVNTPADINTYVSKMSKQYSINQEAQTLNKEAQAMTESVTIELAKANSEIEQLKQANIALQKELEQQKHESNITKVKFAFSKFDLPEVMLNDIALMSLDGQKAVLEREEQNLKLRAESLRPAHGASHSPEKVKTFLGMEI